MTHTCKTPKKGTKLTILTNGASHTNLKKGQFVYYVRKWAGGSKNDAIVSESLEYLRDDWHIRQQFYEIYEEKTVEYFKEKLNGLTTNYKKETKEIQEKIDFLKSSGIEIYDEEQIKIYKILKQIDTNKTTEQKTKIVSKIING